VSYAILGDGKFSTEENVASLELYVTLPNLLRFLPKGYITLQICCRMSRCKTDYVNTQSSLQIATQ
jgi:hypothetical protein